MEIHEQQVGETLVLALSGRLTITDRSGALKDTVTRALGTGTRHVIVDLAEVSYIDSTRLGELIAVHVTIARQQCRLTLVQVPERVLTLLALAGLTTLFEQRATVDDARL